MRFHIYDGVDIIAPLLMNQDWNEAEVLGSAVWLWMHSASHRNFPLQSLSSLLLPAIKHRQFILGYEAGRPVFYLSWANLSAAAEQRYINQPAVLMSDSDWQSGERLWILDWITPFGQTIKMNRIVRQQLFAGRCGRYLYHRGSERGLKIKTFHGSAIFPHEARDWFAHHPVLDTPSDLAMPFMLTDDSTGECV